MLIGVGVMIAIAGIVTASYFYMNRVFHAYKVEQERERKDSNGVTYQTFQNQLLKYSKDGISLVNDKGEDVWNGGYEMENPDVQTAGDYVLVTDIGAKQFYRYGGDEKKGEDSGEIHVETDYPIGRARVTSSGDVVVLLQDTDSNVITVYRVEDGEARVRVEIPTNVSDNGYPLDYDLSPDGESMVVSYMEVKGSQIETKLCFYNFSKVGQDQNNMMGGESLGNTMVGGIHYLDSDRVLVLGEKGFFIYSNMKQPKKVVSESFKEVIASADFREDHLVLVTGKDDQKEGKTLHLYNARGKLQKETPITFSYEEMIVCDREILFKDRQECRIMRMNGKLKASFDFGRDIDAFLPAWKDDQYYLMDSSTIKRIRISENA